MSASRAGGGYDVNARLVARHIGRYIPGNPQVIVREHAGRRRPGDDQLSSPMSPPRTACTSARRSAAFRSSRCWATHSHAKFDAVKLQWIGSANADTSVAVVHARTGVKTWQDLKTKD